MTLDKAAFFTTVRQKLGPLKQAQVEGAEAVLAAVDGLPLSWQAYALATAWHETAATMQPVVEAYWLSEDWRKKHLRYWPHHGRGYVQLTWPQNYAKTDAALAEAGMIERGDLIANPDLALRPDIAAFILRWGMVGGKFTGVRFNMVLPAKGVATRAEYMNARTIINGRDKSDLIEDYAQAFERALRDGGLA